MQSFRGYKSLVSLRISSFHTVERLPATICKLVVVAWRVFEELMGGGGSTSPLSTGQDRRRFVCRALVGLRPTFVAPESAPGLNDPWSDNSTYLNVIREEMVTSVSTRESAACIRSELNRETKSGGLNTSPPSQTCPGSTRG